MNEENKREKVIYEGVTSGDIYEDIQKSFGIDEKSGFDSDVTTKYNFQKFK